MMVGGECLTLLELHMVRERIELASASELPLIVKELTRRYEALFPDEEVIFLSLPKEGEAERVRIMNSALRIAQMEHEK